MKRGKAVPTFKPGQNQASSRMPPRQRATTRMATDILHSRPAEGFFSTKTTILSSRPLSTSPGAVVWDTMLNTI